jgi:hypothetical protein
MIWSAWVSGLVLSAPAWAFAQMQPTSAVVRTEESDRSQVTAAACNAIETLRRDIEQRRIDAQSDLTVRDFLDRTSSEDQFVKTLRRAEQIGGPRWIDDQTCQVKLEIGGDRVAAALVEIANADPQRSPMSPEALDQRLSDWKRRSFVATGSSIRADRAQFVRPSSGSAEGWRLVDDAARATAVAAARDNAAQRVLDSIKPIRIGDVSVGDLLNREELNRGLTNWLRSRPVTSLRYTENLQVEYQPAVAGDELYEAFVHEAQRANVKLPDDPAVLAKAAEEFRQRLANASTTGRAVAQPGAIANPGAPGGGGGGGMMFAAQTPPPDWVFRQIDAEGSAKSRQSLLRTKQAAEEQATEAIRDKFMALQLSPGQTIGEVAKTDPDVRAAVERAMSRVRVYKVDYGANGEVVVKMMMDPREFWWDLTRP